MVAARRRGAGCARVRAGHRAACAGAGRAARRHRRRAPGGRVLWRSAARTTRPRAWRLLAVAPLLPGRSGVLVTCSWGPWTRWPWRCSAGRRPCPATSWRSSRSWRLVDRRRLRAGPRVAVEVALFLGACLVVVGLLVVGPAGRWSGFGLAERLVLGSAVLATSAIMAAALTLLGVIEAARRPMAVVLLAGTVLLTLGRGWPRPPCSRERRRPRARPASSIAAGLLLLALAVLLDSRDRPRPPTRGAARRRRGPLLPHFALLARSPRWAASR